MTSLRLRFLGFAGLMALCLALVAAQSGRKNIMIEVFVVSNHVDLQEADVTISWTQPTPGEDFAAMEGPNPHARFTIPAGNNTVAAHVESDGYCPLNATLTIGGKPHVGGQAYWLFLVPGCTSSATR